MDRVQKQREFHSNKLPLEVAAGGRCGVELEVNRYAMARLYTNIGKLSMIRSICHIREYFCCMIDAPLLVLAVHSPFS